MCVAVHPQDGSLVCGVNEEPARVAQGENAHVRVFGYTTTTAPAARADAAAGRAELSVTITPRAAVPSLGITDPEHYQKTATFSPDGSLLALASSDGKVQLHRYPSLEPVWTSATSAVPGGKEVYDTDFSHDGTQLAITTAAQIIVLSTAPKTTEEGGVLTYTPRVLQTIENANIGSAQRGSFRMAQFGRSTGLSVGTRDRLFALVNTTPAPGSKTRACYVAAWDADAWKMLGARKVSNRPGTVLAVRYVAGLMQQQWAPLGRRHIGSQPVGAPGTHAPGTFPGSRSLFCGRRTCTTFPRRASHLRPTRVRS